MSLIVLKTLVDIYRTNKDGSQKTIKRNIECKKTFETNNISIEEHINANGSVSKRLCNLKDGDSYHLLNHTFTSVHELIKPIYIQGFKRYN